MIGNRLQSHGWGGLAQRRSGGACRGPAQGAEHDGRTYNVTGPEAIILHEATEELSRATTRRITYHTETVEEVYSEITAPPTRMVA